MAALAASTRTTLALFLLILLGMATLVLPGCSADTGTAGEGTISRSYGTPDPCQRTLVRVIPAEGVDLAQAGTKLVDAFEGYNGIADVVLDPETATLDVTWCISMQNEEGIIRAVNLSGLVAIESAQTTPIQ